MITTKAQRMITTKTPRRGVRSQKSEVRIGLPFSSLLTSDFWLLPLCLCALVVTLLGLAGAALAQTDVIGSHDLSPGGTSPIKGTLSGSCLYCHAPHSGLNGTAGVAQTPLWNQKLSSVQSYTVYTQFDPG